MIYIQNMLGFTLNSNVLRAFWFVFYTLFIMIYIHNFLYFVKNSALGSRKTDTRVGKESVWQAEV